MMNEDLRATCYPYQLDDEIMYKQFKKLSPKLKMMANRSKRIEFAGPRVNNIRLKDGFISIKELNAIMRALPFEISFIDRDNKLRYYNSKKERIFARIETVLGRPVDLCHPPRSIHLVKKIVEDLKEGRKNKVFWINMGDRSIYIAYFPVRDEDGKYLGILEIDQDITDLKKITGEKLLK